MKIFLKIAGTIVGLFIVIIIGLNIYFTDERLKNTVMPYVNDAVGRTVNVEQMSLTLFSTFPQPGVSIQNMSIPGETEEDTLLSLDELVVSVELFSLLGDQINISELSLRNPKFTYIVNADSTTNIDFLMTEEAETDTTAETMGINIPYFNISGGDFGYRDATTETNVQLDDLNADITLNYADLITSTIDLQLGGLSASMGESTYLNNLPLSMTQQSTINMENETVTLDEGTFSIRGLALNLTGSLSDWSNDLNSDLTFNSSSDNFGELLRLIPADYEEYTEGLESRGSLAIDGTINGALLGEELPNFDIRISVDDGYVKNPDLPQAIESIQLTANASNKLIAVENLTAKAGENNLSANGELQNPLEDNGTFSIDFDSDVNLATIRNFYDISQFDVENLGGQLTANGQASGNMEAPEKATFDATISLSNGLLKYAEVAKPIENITIDAEANQSVITINNMKLQAAANTFSMKGSINEPMDEEQRSIDLTTNLDFDLATIKDFYPIDEDTLSMRGQFKAQAVLKGKADQIENAVQSGNISLSDGYISHKSLGKPIENITLNSSLDGPDLTISKASFTTGDNNLDISGNVRNYLSDDRTVNVELTGKAALNQIKDYYELEPTITELTGLADLNLRVQGKPNDPANMQFNGQLTAQNINMDGEAMVQPVTELNGVLNLSPSSVDLDGLSFNIGSSDISLSGSLSDYMEYLKAEEDRSTTPQLTGTYKSELLNLDELIDWSDTTETGPIPIHLPHLTSSVSAEINEMIVTGVTMTNMTAEASTTPEKITLEQASINMFNGKATGSFVWEVPDPERTMISFNGNLDSLQAAAFFDEFQVLGEDSNFHEYVSGAFSADVEYYSELNEFLEPVIKTSTMDGNFGMTNSRIQGHPIQERLASLFNAKEFNNVGLDEFESTYSLKNSVFTINDLQMTSKDIGMELSGTQHMVKGTIDYKTQLLLPGRFKKGIASVITTQATEALTRDNGTIMVPLRMTGTQEDPNIRPDKKEIAPIVKDYLKDKGKNLLKGLFDN
ncbi:hypothetical protein CK503_10885 [Aliifodinibius salipaludis]|uniref:AsmA-like C-terminal domain-containing protein n=1 Tax=Fodinibius salipaludis TaxID=2032627 RepID=A0A2A2G7Q1_9BACT|nr:AsmA-like C-terminal region-containing protein [Aliifodinibius salipaludis]PAU93651.1 hypothetical protein CK503_10885 [Aliifodinibius salipaludis]